jgi:hypothetical protein
MSILIPDAENGPFSGSHTNGNRYTQFVDSLASDSTVHQTSVGLPLKQIVEPRLVKTSWVAGKLQRKLGKPVSELRFQQTNLPAQVGDCVLTRISKVGNHKRIFTEDNQYFRVFNQDYLIGILGARYATDAYHATRIDTTQLHILTNGGLLGTVCDSHTSMSAPTRLELFGYLVDDSGNRINYKDAFYRPTNLIPGLFPVFTVGTGMNSGKTTSTARLAQALSSRGSRVAVLKLTGSASHRDIHEYNGTGAVFTADFSDYGFPSTYLTGIAELEGLYGQMMNDAAAASPDIVLIEIADGVYQRETEMLLNSPLIKSTSSGLILTALCAASGLAIDQTVRNMGWKPLFVTGLITNAPLFVQEFEQRSQTPVVNTDKGIQDACRVILERVSVHQLGKVQVA